MGNGSQPDAQPFPQGVNFVGSFVNFVGTFDAGQLPLPQQFVAMQAESTAVPQTQTPPRQAAAAAPYQAMHMRPAPQPHAVYTTPSTLQQPFLPCTRDQSKALGLHQPQSPMHNHDARNNPSPPHGHSLQLKASYSNSAGPTQHPYLVHQTAAQYPSPPERARAAARRSSRRAPSVEAESPAEPQARP